jgi:hypothetical protein
MPVSFASCTPLPLASNHTKSPNENWRTKPKSNVVSLTPNVGVVIGATLLRRGASSAPLLSSASVAVAPVAVGS